MSIEDRRNYWSQRILDDHERWWRKLLLPLGAILAVVVACVIFLVGMRVGQESIIDEACSTKAGRYYLQETCDGRP